MHLPSRETEGVEIQVMLIKNPKAAQMIRGIRSEEPGMSAKNSSTCLRKMTPATASARMKTRPRPILVK